MNSRFLCVGHGSSIPRFRPKLRFTRKFKATIQNIWYGQERSSTHVSANLSESETFFGSVLDSDLDTYLSFGDRIIGLISEHFSFWHRMVYSCVSVIFWVRYSSVQACAILI